MLAFITSAVIRKSTFDITLQKGKTGLLKDSTLRLKKIMTVHKSLILGTIGNLSEEQLNLIENTLRKMLNL